MPVLGLVLTLADGSKAGRGALLDRLLRERDICIGDFEQGKLPVVLEVAGRRDAEPRVREPNPLVSRRRARLEPHGIIASLPSGEYETGRWSIPAGRPAKWL